MSREPNLSQLQLLLLLLFSCHWTISSWMERVKKNFLICQTLSSSSMEFLSGKSDFDADCKIRISNKVYTYTRVNVLYKLVKMIFEGKDGWETVEEWWWWCTNVQRRRTKDEEYGWMRWEQVFGRRFIGEKRHGRCKKLRGLCGVVVHTGCDVDSRHI